MLVHEDPNLSTGLFCRSGLDGTIEPEWTASRRAELRGSFETGLTVGGRYLLQQPLGQGAMGQVFLAKDLRLGRLVAMKVVVHRRRDDGDLGLLLSREARLGASLNHRGIAAVYDFGFQDNKSYTVFEYVEGDTLRNLMGRRGPIPLAEVLPVVSDVAAALDYAHSQGVIHRDLKPENICCTRRGEFKILDFGIARDIQHDLETGTYSGTPAYSSPEQSACRPTDGRSDQYALGLIVFEMLTGRRAFQAASPLSLLHLQIAAPPPRPRDFVPDLPETAERAMLRALHKQADDRFSTCQEFFLTLCGGNSAPARRHVMSTPVEHRLGFYIGHIADESLLARQLADALESRSYSCWYYGRDAIAGVPFTRQFQAAMERSQAMILLVSRAALRSVDLAREIEHARQVGSPVLPLLIDVPREEFEKLAPSWCRLLGASPLIEHRRAEPLGPVIQRLALSAAALHVAPDPHVRREDTAVPSRCTGQIWATDANQIDILDLPRVLFHNATIDDFLRGKHRHFISAPKGFGKTLLLTCKRQLLTQWAAHEQAVLMIPEGRPYLDFMSELRSLSARYEKPLSDLTNTKRLWSAALRISAISHHPSVLEPGDDDELEVFPARIRRWLQGTRIQPTVTFKELTALSVSELNRLIDETENFLDQKLRMIHGGTLFFIDKVDQAIRQLGRDAWIAIQAGLIEAAWETMNANSHVKVYATIRQEAFSNYQSDIKSNLFAATTSLHYSEEELQTLLDQLARCYEGCGSFTEFLGLRVVRHGRRPAPEDSFQYVRRHTFGRPRDLVAIASEISSKRAALSEKRLRDIVQHTSSSMLVANIFEEVRVFLTCLDDRAARLRLLSLLPGNILEKADAVRVCEAFNGLEPGSLQHFGENSSDIHHPFRDLYYTGMLGILERDPESGEMIQRFRQAHDSFSMAAALPESPVYLLHPALDTFIRRHGARTPFLQFQHIPVGEHLVWESHFPTLLQLEKRLHDLDDNRLVDAAHTVIKRVQALLKSDRLPFARIDIERSDEWQLLGQYEKDPRCDDVRFWLGELLESL